MTAEKPKIALMAGGIRISYREPVEEISRLLENEEVPPEVREVEAAVMAESDLMGAPSHSDRSENESAIDAGHSASGREIARRPVEEFRRKRLVEIVFSVNPVGMVVVHSIHEKVVCSP
jgi:hypothetical protein